jgi:penicillin-binding protein 2
MVHGSNRSNESIELKRRFYIFSAIPILMFSIMVAVLFSLQIVKGPHYAMRAKANREQFSILPALRGVILDRTGEIVLANNRRAFAVNIVPQNLPQDAEERSRMFKKLSLLLNMSEDEIKAAMDHQNSSKYGSYVLKTDVPFKDIVFLAEHNREFPGVYWKSMPVRIYQEGSILAHVLGYVGMISEEELLKLAGKGYNMESVIGKYGIEKVYDNELKGKDGFVRRIVDATNQVTAEIIDKGAEPLPGNNLVLTIDSRVQKLAEEALGERIGAVIVSRPSTGEILAMVSFPDFNPNLFVSQLDREEFKRLTLDTRKPFVNRAIQAQYPAGSIFKLVVAMTILESGKIPLEKEYTCGGGYQLGNRFFSCWRNHGKGINFRRAIVESCDSYFYQTSLVLGPDLIASYARKLGLGRKLGIDLIGEMSGLVPDPQWKRENIGDIWYEGDTLNLSIGQGYILVTPLQINALTNIIANRGILMKPFILKEVRSSRDGELLYRASPEILIDTGIEKSHFEKIIEAMRGVVTEGTAKWGGAVLSTEVAAKTSTSEVSGGFTHSWFTAFAPYNSHNGEDVISVTAVVEYGGAGSQIAAPIVSEIIEAYFAKCDLETARRNIWHKRSQMMRKTDGG